MRANRASSRGFSDYFSNLPIKAGLAVIFRDGDRDLPSTKLYGRNIIIVRTQFEPRIAGSVLIEPDWVAFFVPLGFAGTFLFTGCEAIDNRLYVSAGPFGYTTIGERRDTVAIGIRRKTLLAAFADLNIPEDRLTDAALDLDPTGFKRLRKLIDNTTADTPAVGEDADEPSPKLDWEEGFLSEFLGLVLPVIAQGPLVPLDTEKLAIVRAAEKACLPLGAQCTTLARMCSLAGVGQTKLWSAFRHIYGHSPVDYLNYLRINRAREALLDRESPPPSVKDVSLSLGFTNSGRFAKLYGECFGEMPSVTLATTRNKGGLDG